MDKKILIIRFSAIGDVAMLVPVIKAAAERYPDLSITVLTSERLTTLFATCPPNVRAIGANLKGDHAGRKGLNQLLTTINFKSFDVLLDMHSVWRSWYIRCRFILIGKPTYGVVKDRLKKFFFTHSQLVRKFFIKQEQPITPVQKRYAELFKKIGYDIDLHPTKNDGHWDKKDIGIAPFAAHNNKVYPIEKMETLIQKLSAFLAKYDEKIYLFGGGEREKYILTAWAEKYENVESLVGKMTFAEEMEKIRHLRMMLTMDSANLHIASLVQTRVISIWGATHPKCGFYDFNQQPNDCIQRDLPCRPCSIYGKRPCKFDDIRCLNIDEQVVFSKIRQIYETRVENG